MLELGVLLRWEIVKALSQGCLKKGPLCLTQLPVRFRVPGLGVQVLGPSGSKYAPKEPQYLATWILRIIAYMSRSLNS